MIGKLTQRLIERFKQAAPESQHQSLELPKLPCSRWILLRGPAIRSLHHRGTLLVEATSILDWAKAHAQRVWSSDSGIQSTRHSLPFWIEGAVKEDETVTIPSEEILDVLQPYDEDFIENAVVRLWCPDCKRLHFRVISSTRDDQRIGKRSLWVAEWRCPDGHLVHSEPHEIRWIIR
jgi:hypothetical protein